MSTVRALLFFPQGDVEEYAGVRMPDTNAYPVGTWAYLRDAAYAKGISPWVELAQYTAPRRIQWEYRAIGEDADVPSKFRMIALVMP